MVPFSRRRALRAAAGASAFALAGCSALGGGCEPRKSLTLTGVTATDVARDAARTADRDASNRTDQLGPLDATLARAAAASDATTYHAAGERPMPDEEGFFRVDGTYYEYAVQPVASATVAGTTLHLYWDDVTDADGQSGDAVRFDALPVHDRRTLLALLETKGADYFVDFESFFDERDRVDVGRSVGYPDEALVDSSQIVPEPVYGYVRFHGHYLQLSATGTGETEVTTYEVTTETVDGGADAVADAWLSAVGLDLATRDLSAEQHDILEQAIDGTYAECAEYSAAFAELGEMLGPVLYVRYEGSWYRERLVESR